MIDPRFSSSTPSQLFQKVDMSELQRAFDKDHRFDEDQELRPFGLRATTEQLNLALAYFGLKTTDLNVMNVGESNEV